MAGGIGLGGGGFAALRSGMLEEQKRVEETRLRRMKSLQELADQAAANGQQLSFDSLFELAGANGINLFGDAPTSQMVETLRLAQNAKAQEVERKRAYDEALRQDDLINRVRAKAADLYRSGVTDPMKLHDEVVGVFGPAASEVTKKIVPAIGQEVETKDFAEGIKLGSAFQTVEEAEHFITSGGINGRQADGIRRAASANQQRLFSDLMNRADAAGREMDPNDAMAFESAVRGYLTPEERKLPGVEAYFRERMATAAKRRQSGDRIAIQAKQGEAMAGYTPQFVGLGMQLDAQAEEKGKEAARAAYTQSLGTFASAQKALAQERDAEIKARKKLTPEQEAYFSAAAQLELSPEQATELRQLAFSGDKEAFNTKLRFHMATARPAEEAALAKAQLAHFAAGGDIPYGTPASQAYEKVSTFDQAYDDKVLASRGQTYRELKQRGRADDAKKTLDETIAAAARDIIAVRNTLSSSGKVSIAPEELEALERQRIQRLAGTLAASTGEPADAIAQAIYAKRPPAFGGITRRVLESERLAGQANPLYEKFGLAGLGGGSTASVASALLPPPTGAPRPAGPAQGGDERVQIISGELAAARQRLVSAASQPEQVRAAGDVQALERELALLGVRPRATAASAAPAAMPAAQALPGRPTPVASTGLADSAQGKALDAAKAEYQAAVAALQRYGLVQRSRDPQGFAAAQREVQAARIKLAAAQEAWQLYAMRSGIR